MQPAPLHISEENILSFRRGEERGFVWAFREFYPSLIFFANKLTGKYEAAEEIASTAFIKIWQRHFQFSSSESIRAYLYQIVRNDCLKWLAAQKKVADAYKELIYFSTNEQPDHFQRMVQAETLRQLQASIELLPAECGRVFKLLYIEGKSVKETAEELKVSVSTVKTQKQRGLATLRKKLTAVLSMLIIAIIRHWCL